MRRTLLTTLVFIYSFSSLAAPPAVDDFSIDVLAEDLFKSFVEAVAMRICNAAWHKLATVQQGPAE